MRLFCCLPPLSLVFTGFPLIAPLRTIVQNGELFGIVGYTFAREVGCIYWLPAYCTIAHDCAKR
nr:MAG TPA: hypothetical protein [Caudoviricetes sp.]